MKDETVKQVINAMALLDQKEGKEIAQDIERKLYGLDCVLQAAGGSPNIFTVQDLNEPGALGRLIHIMARNDIYFIHNPSH